MRKRLFLLMLFLSSAFALKAVEIRDSIPWYRKVSFGGNFGLSGTTGFFIAEVSPLANYAFNRRFSAGAGPVFIYINQRISATQRREDFIYGARVYGRFFFTENLFGHLEGESVNYRSSIGERVWAPSLWAGGGYAYYVSSRMGVYVSFLYNVLNTSRTPYASPYAVRVGVLYR